MEVQKTANNEDGLGEEYKLEVKKIPINMLSEIQFAAAMRSLTGEELGEKIEIGNRPEIIGQHFTKHFPFDRWTQNEITVVGSPEELASEFPKGLRGKR